jgi:hypothetical protein
VICAAASRTARAVAEFPVARSTAALLASIVRALTLKPGRG